MSERAARERKRLGHWCHWIDRGANTYGFQVHECLKCSRRQVYAHGKWLDVEPQIQGSNA